MSSACSRRRCKTLHKCVFVDSCREEHNADDSNQHATVHGFEGLSAFAINLGVTAWKVYAPLALRRCSSSSNRSVSTSVQPSSRNSELITWSR